MASAPRRDNEAARLAALRRLQVLDTPPEPEFDALARAASLACGLPLGTLCLPLRRADGEQLWVHTVGSAGVVKGKPVRLVGAFQDVTERHHEHESLLRARERLRVQPAPPAAQSSRAQLR